MGSARTTDKVFSCLEKRIGEVTNIDYLLVETGLTRAQVQSCISALRKTNTVDLQVIVQGTAWIYHGANKTPAAPKTSSRKVFEEVGVTRDGTHIIQDEEGNLFKAEEL